MNMLETQKNSKLKGTVGVGSAIEYFTSQGAIVSVPLNDSQSYDLVVEWNGALKRVQVKTTTCVTKYGAWEVPLRVTGGNQSFFTAKLFDKTSCDLLFVLTSKGRRWLIPTEIIEARNAIYIGKKSYVKFEIIAS